MSRLPSAGACALELLDLRRHAGGERHAAPPDADQHQVLDALVALDDLVRDAGHDAPQTVGVDDLGLLPERHGPSRRRMAWGPAGRTGCGADLSGRSAPPASRWAQRRPATPTGTIGTVRPATVSPARFHARNSPAVRPAHAQQARVGVHLHPVARGLGAGHREEQRAVAVVEEAVRRHQVRGLRVVADLPQRLGLEAGAEGEGRAVGPRVGEAALAVVAEVVEEAPAVAARERQLHRVVLPLVLDGAGDRVDAGLARPVAHVQPPAEEPAHALVAEEQDGRRVEEVQVGERVGRRPGAAVVLDHLVQHVVDGHGADGAGPCGCAIACCAYHSRTIT